MNKTSKEPKGARTRYRLSYVHSRVFANYRGWVVDSNWTFRWWVGFESAQEIPGRQTTRLVDSWKLIGQHVASRFGGPEFLPVPYLLEANAYGIGHVFVPVTSEAGCFRANTQFKLIGPMGKFVLKPATDPRWYEGEFPAIKASPEDPNLKVKLGSGNREIVFTANNCYYLRKPENMVATRDVTIDRSSHEDLTNAKWIGLISEVVASDVFQMEITAQLRGRTFHVGDSGAHTFLFKYDICELDEAGVVCRVTRNQKRLKNTKWEPVDKTERDNLPLSSLD